VRSLACTRRRVALSKFNSHMQTGKTHTLRPKACCRARDGLTRWRGIAGCRRRRPGGQGSRQGGPTPRGDTGPRVGRMDGRGEGLWEYDRVYRSSRSIRWRHQYHATTHELLLASMQQDICIYMYIYRYIDRCISTYVYRYMGTHKCKETDIDVCRWI